MEVGLGQVRGIVHVEQEVKSKEQEQFLAT